LEDWQVGRALLDIAAKRGYKSMRGVDDTGDSEYLATIANHEEALKKHPTVGAYLASLPTCKNVILRRETYEAEYYKLCEVQGIDPQRYYSAIFRQRPLKKGKIAFCKMEPNRKVTHASNPLFEKFRMLRDVANIDIYDADNSEVDITKEHRAAFLEHLRVGKDLTKAGALKIMGIKKPAAYSWYSGKSIAGSAWAKMLSPSLSSLQSLQSLQSLWQDLMAATDDNLLIEILKRKYCFPHEYAVAVAGYDIKAMGWSDYSEKAVKKLLPAMESGRTLREATLDVYGKVDFGTAVALRNVVLEQVHAGAAALVAAIKKTHNINELQIEIDSALKMGNKARKARATGKRRQEKDNAELDKRIVAVSGTVNEYNRKKLRLWDEMGGRCPYFPEAEIPLAELFTDKYNLDHVVPKSKLFDFSDDNLVLCPTAANSEKLRTTGADFASATGSTEPYVAFVNAAKISERKRSLLLMREDDIPTDYVSRRAGADYNTRCFLALHPQARCIPNKLVNMYAKKWYITPYDDNDVRSVLVKSFAMANMDGDTVAYFDNIRQHTEGTTSAGAYDLQPSIALPDLSDVPVFCPKIKFFRKTKFGYTARFSLHKETVYGQRKRAYRNAKGDLKEEVFYKIRHPLNRITPKMASNISDAAILRLVEARVKECGGHAEFLASIAERPLMFNGKPVHSVSVNVSGELLFPLHSASGGRTGKLAAHERKVDYVYSSMNYSLRIVDGKRKATPLLAALRQLNEGSFDRKGIHLNDSVLYEGKQYIVSGLRETGIDLRSAYTLLAENAVKLTKVSEIEKIEKHHVAQVS
jgi:hypothetical protein